MRKFKIAIIVTRMDLGGAQQAALEVAARLDPERFDARLIAGEGGLLWDEARARLGGRALAWPSLVHPIAPWQDLKAVLGLAWMLNRGDFDLVHTHSSKAGLVGRLAAFLAGVPCVAHTAHGWSFNDSQPALARRAYALLERGLALGTQALVAVAESVRDKGLLMGIGRPSQYRVIRAAVDLGAWSLPRLSPEERAGRLRGLGLPRDAKLVATLANLKPQKDPACFVATAAAALKAWPGPEPLHFIYIGGGPLLEACQAQAASLGIAERVHFLGWRQDAAGLLACADAFLLTSRFEGLPCVFAQAMSLGLPVVATDVDGAPEIVREGKTGYLCTPGDSQALSQRLLKLLQDPALAQRLGQAGRESLGPEWGLADMAQRHAELYQELLTPLA
jgi:glycosyltransferase involved in cell wall biosynthesis